MNRTLCRFGRSSRDHGHHRLAVRSVCLKEGEREEANNATAVKCAKE
jgi:hypothetical protein